MAPHISFTKTYHSNTYPSISPLRPELSCKGKTVIITGAASLIGTTAAHAFAEAGAACIGLIGRTEATLSKAKADLLQSFPHVKVAIAVADVSVTESIGLAAHNVRVEIGAWDVFVANAGYLEDMAPLTGQDTDDWWKAFEINVKSLQLFSKHFLPKARLPDSTFIAVNAGAAHVGPEVMGNISAYASSKIAAAKLVEFLCKENPQLRAFNVHPGIVWTPLSQKMIGGAEIPPAGLPMDDPKLPADFFVWCASSEADFLIGRFVWANWDVDEMKAKKEKVIADKGLLRVTIGGWPFSQE